MKNQREYRENAISGQTLASAVRLSQQASWGTTASKWCREYLVGIPKTINAIKALTPAFCR